MWRRRGAPALWLSLGFIGLAVAVTVWYVSLEDQNTFTRVEAFLYGMTSVEALDVAVVAIDNHLSGTPDDEMENAVVYFLTMCDYQNAPDLGEKQEDRSDLTNYMIQVDQTRVMTKDVLTLEVSGHGRVCMLEGQQRRFGDIDLRVERVPAYNVIVDGEPEAIHQLSLADAREWYERFFEDALPGVFLGFSGIAASFGVSQWFDQTHKSTEKTVVMAEPANSPPMEVPSKSKKGCFGCLFFPIVIVLALVRQSRGEQHSRAE